MAAASSRVLVYGGRGALGSTIVKYFKSKNYVSSLEYLWNGVGEN